MAALPQPGSGKKPQTTVTTGLFRLGDWLYVIPIGVLAVALAVWGFTLCTDREKCTVTGISIANLASMVAKAVALIRGNMPFSLDQKHPWQLVVAQFVLPGLALYGGFRVVLHNVRRDVRVALARRQRNHTIVCGLSDSGRQIVENLRAGGGRVVAISLDADEPNAVACERLRVPVLRGDATQLDMLVLAGLRRADTVFVTCGSDSINIEVALRINEAIGGSRARTKRLRVLPEVRSAWLLALLRGHPTATLSAGAVETRPFDLAVNAARLLLRSPAFGRLWRVLAHPTARPLQPHLVIAGLGDLGMQIIAQSVQCTFAIPDCRLAVTVLDQQGEDSSAVFDARYPGLQTLIDREFVPATFEADKPAAWPAAWQAVTQALEKRPGHWTTVAVVVALKDDNDALHTALELRERLDKLGCVGTPIFVRLRQQHKLGQFVASLDGPQGLLDRVIPFGDLGVLTSPDVLIDEIQDRLAREMHEVYLAGGQGASPSGEANVPWVRLPEYLKESNRAFADHIPVKLACVGARLVAGDGPPADLTDGIDAMSIAEHRRWMVERFAAGWTLGERDPVARHSPYLIPWEELDEDTRDKDRILVRAIPDSIARAGMSVRRERVIEAFGAGLDDAEAALAEVGAGEQAVVVFDPREANSWRFAKSAAGRGAKLWVLWREGSHAPLIAPEPLPAGMRAAIELAISEREVLAMRPAPMPAVEAATAA